jgi:hypothetical protein
LLRDRYRPLPVRAENDLSRAVLIKICATTLGETGGDALSGKQRTMILGG